MAAVNKHQKPFVERLVGCRWLNQHATTTWTNIVVTQSAARLSAPPGEDPNRLCYEHSADGAVMLWRGKTASYLQGGRHWSAPCADVFACVGRRCHQTLQTLQQPYPKVQHLWLLLLPPLWPTAVLAGIEAHTPTHRAGALPADQVCREDAQTAPVTSLQPRGAPADAPAVATETPEGRTP